MLGLDPFLEELIITFPKCCFLKKDKFWKKIAVLKDVNTFLKRRPQSFSWVEGIGHSLIKEVTFEIDGIPVEKQVYCKHCNNLVFDICNIEKYCWICHNLKDNIQRLTGSGGGC